MIWIKLLNILAMGLALCGIGALLAFKTYDSIIDIGILLLVCAVIYIFTAIAILVCDNDKNK